MNSKEYQNPLMQERIQEVYKALNRIRVMLADQKLQDRKNEDKIANAAAIIKRMRIELEGDHQ